MTRAVKCEIGLLDFGSKLPGLSAGEVARRTLLAARLAERLGFSRYWLAEHHAPDGAWANPVPLIAALATATTTIRVGTGGSLVHVHSPLALANDAALLGALFPGRIDLGFARGLPSVSTRELLDVSAPARAGAPQSALTFAHFSRRVQQTCRLLAGASIGSGEEAVRCIPGIAQPAPEMWVLGNSLSSGTLAADVGASFAFSLMHSERPDLAGVTEYRRRLDSSASGARARVGVAVAGFCTGPAHHVRSHSPTRLSASLTWPTVCGTGDRCREELQAIEEKFSPDLILFLDLTSSWDERERSITSLADALDLS
jgi:luciferase family oxidoreductase group 1